MAKKRPSTSRNSSSLLNQHEYPSLRDIMPNEPVGSSFPYLNGPKLRRKQYFTLMQGILAETKLGHKVTPDYSRLTNKIQQPYEIMKKHAEALRTTPNTKYIDRDILKRLAAPKLAEDFRDVLLAMMNEVQQEFVNVTHQVGVICVIKPDNVTEGHITLKPYQLPGKTDFHKRRLQIIKHLETRLFITLPLIRGILNFCVQDLPECLINFSQYRDKAYEIDELHQIFNDEIAKARSLIRTWYRDVLSFVRFDETSIASALELNYFTCGTGLISVYLSRALRSTIEHLMEVTEYREKIPYLKMNLRYCRKILLEPSLSKICHLYVQLVEKIASMADDLPALEASYCIGHDQQLIPIFIFPEQRKFFKEQIQSNIVKLFTPVVKYINELNEEFSGLYATPQEPDEEVEISKDQETPEETSTELAKPDIKKHLSFKPELDIIEFEETAEEEVEEYMDLDKDITFEEGYIKVDFYRSFINKLSKMVDIEYYRVGQLKQFTCRNAISTALHSTVEKISNKLVQQHLWENEDICEQYETLVLRASTIPKSSDELVELMTYVSWASTELLPTLTDRIESSLIVISRLIEMTLLSDDHINLSSRIVHWIDDIKPILEQNTTMSEACKFEFEERLQRNLEVLQGSVKEFFPQLELLDEMDDANHTREYLNSIAELLVVIKDFDKQLAAINKEEAIFKFPLTSIAELKELKSHLYPFHRLVKVCFDWKRSYGAWATGPLKFLGYTAAEIEINDYSKELEKSQKDYRNQIRQAITEGHRMKFKGLVDDPDPCNHPAPIKLCSKTLQEIKNFRPSLNMMKIMCNDALLQRHWDEMSEIAGFDMTPNSGTTLNKLMSLGLEKDIDKYEIISTGALKERQLLENLIKMQREWDEIFFKTGVHKDTEIIILVQLDDIQVILDDHILKTLTMRGSVFVKPYEVEVKQWYEKIIRMNSTLEEWDKVQTQWLYLLPLFSSEDIVNQMPEEGHLFRKVDEVHCRYMDMIIKDARVIQTTGSVEVLEDLRNCIKLLERINEGVNEYLESKRLLFPRFFFLSNLEMLEILSETKNPLCVQQHLNKCFDGIDTLEFDNKFQIHGILSREKEKVEFISVVNTEDARGSVEKWLVQVETQMRVSIRDNILKSLAVYNCAELSNWVQAWPGQVILAVSQILWTSKIHLALNSDQSNVLNEFIEGLKYDLEELVNLMHNMDLFNLTRTTIKTLITLGVHIKEIVQVLIKEKINNGKEFKWLAHLRYYWDEDCIIRVINTSIKYAYEYLGNSKRLVVTPLTERCYRTLISAYHLHLNGAPEGPAGTGKTETVKDLAKALAVYCVVFNCSDGLNYKTMGKFLKGLASSGAWACFDELDRIDVEDSSVVAQQMLCVILAVRANAIKFCLEGIELILNPTCYVCVTMNPGYAERKLLPDNLKVLFRPIAMMIPDYMTITEVSLYSSGFKHARNLALKIVTLYQLCWEQFSFQSHYDFGLRSIKSILRTCDHNRQKYPQEDLEAVLLKSILDVNLPKLINHDIALFKDLISDLFPGQYLPLADYEALITAIKQCCAKQNLHANDYFLSKVIQTHEIMLVRPGFMLVGEPFAGKTSTLKVLSDTLKSQEGDIQYQFINPKSVTIEQLYGQFNPLTYEWFDGLIAACFRRFAMDATNYRKWIIFDGPVDAVWVENMNTVLDDNRKLCLISGEVMLVPTTMSIIFETMDLVHASPATISRCGMIYMEPTMTGWKPHVESWIKTCSKEWCESNEQLIFDLFGWLIPPSLSFIRKHCNQFCNSGETNLIKSMMQIVRIILTDACNESTKKEEDFKNMHSWIQAAFLYAGLWGLAGILEATSKEKFDEFYRTIWRGQDDAHPYPNSMEKLEIIIPPDGLLFDYAYAYKGRGVWKYWADATKVVKIEETVNIQYALVPTVDTVKYMHLVEMHLKHNIPVLLVGPTGTGKSFHMHDLLMNKLDKILYEPAFAAFTVNITANQTQELILSKLNKRKRGHYGPPKEKTCIIFIDDLNMPMKEPYGAQPSVELLRQYFDHKSWYDLKNNSHLYLHNILLAAAMEPAGGSRQEIYPRLLRHFTVFAISEFSEESISKIYTNVLLLGFKINGFPADVANQVQQIVAATLSIYGESIKNFRPTPTKRHYIFNLKDFSRIIFGCAMLKKESADHKSTFAKIWVHEVMRVIYDRLIESTEKSWLYNKLRACIEENFKENFDTVFGNLNEDEERRIDEEELQNLMFGTYLDTSSPAEDKKYEEVTNAEAFYSLATNCMREYNTNNRDKIDMVLFKYALEHLSRICRVLTMPCGSALLIGISGSGRQSLTKLATAMAGHSIFQPNLIKDYGINGWHEDVKQVIKEAGGLGKHTVFLLHESQIKQEEFLQDLDCLLNSGEVPNIFQIDEKQEILEMARLDAQGGNRNIDVSALTVLSFFIRRTREKLHVILCLSPKQPTLRTRLRLFPSLVNCCTIIWFEDWPENALEMVAKKWLADVNLTIDLKNSVITTFKYFHKSSQTFYIDYFTATAHKAYVTSASYLELVKNFADLVISKQKELMASKARYVAGLQKLEFASAQIAAMQKALEAYQPQLKEMKEKAAEMTKEIAKETIQVERASSLVRKDEEIANAQAAEAQTLKAECETDLAEAIPILEDAIAALNTLKPTDITLVKSMKNPPDAIKLVMAAVCVIKDVKPDRLPDPSTGRKILDYWGPSKRILGDMNFLQTLKDFDKDHIKPEIMVKIRKEYLPHKDFKPNVVAKASSAAEGLCKWIIAMDMYDKVAKEVAPKKEKLEKAEREYAATMAVLLEKKEEVTRLEKKLADLNQYLAEAKEKQQDLQDRVDACEKKLNRAEKLIGGLGGEKRRWITAAENLQSRFDCLAGDILICSGIVAYLSPFTIQYRLKVMDDWLKYVQELNLPITAICDFIEILGNEIKIENWHAAGLLQDSFSITNAIVLENSKRWCLLMDPQLQANSWLRKMEKENGLQIRKFSDSDYIAVLEACIQNGKPALIENIDEALDTAIDRLILKSTFTEAESVFISLGANTIPYHQDFRLYLTSKLRNPHYLPEVYNKVTVINFSVAITGLEKQLLGIVVGKERPDLQHEGDKLILEGSANKKALANVEDMILKTLSEAKGDILEDEDAIQTLDHSKAKAVDITKKQLTAKESRERIESFRINYKPVASHSAMLYSCILDLPNIDPMYQYSLEWFINLFNHSIVMAKKSRFMDKQLVYLKEGFTYNLYVNVCRSLFEKDRLVFSFLLCLKTTLSHPDEQELLFLLAHIDNVENICENPAPNWLSAKSWKAVHQLDRLATFKDFAANIEIWKNWYDLPEPQLAELPSPWNKKFTPFQKLLIVKALRPDKIKSSISKFVENEIGTKYIIPPPFDIAESFQQSNCICPIVFILSEDTDPVTILSHFAQVKGYASKFRCISMGQGQGPIAEALIKQGQAEGSWVCLQNCHHAIPWMVKLAKLCENLITSNTNMHFRLWLTSASSDKFPVSVLHNSIKMINDPPIGLQHNLLRSYLSHPMKDPDFYKSCPGNERMFSRMLYGMAFFHSVIQERTTFGPIGWNNPYEFNESDFNISVHQLQTFVNECNENPFEGISYLAAECNYGGRITDEWDRRLIITLLKDYINPEVVSNMNYTFSTSGNCYRLLRKAEYEEYLSHVEGIPQNHPPEVFGLHANAAIAKDLKESETLLNSVTLVRGGENPTEKHFLKSAINDILSELACNFDLETAKDKYPAEYGESMNIILIQEMECFNTLLNKMRNSLNVLQKALEGLQILTPALEALHASLISGRIPAAWSKVSYPSLKSLPDYMLDFTKRIEFIQKWFDKGKPDVFWLSGFYCPQAFLSRVKQTYARKHKISIDHLIFDFEISRVSTTEHSPKDGVYINGLFTDGARWDLEKGVLGELLPKTFNDSMPMIWLKPVCKNQFKESGRYVCPLYQTSERRGVLSTTGHSSNYVLPFLLDTEVDPSHWIKRSVALLCQLN